MKKFTKQISSLLTAMAVGASSNPGSQFNTVEAVETTGNTRVIRLDNIESADLYEYYEGTTTTTITTTPQMLGTYYDHGTTQPTPTVGTSVPGYEETEYMLECNLCGESVPEGKGIFEEWEEDGEIISEFYCYDCYDEVFPPTAGVMVAEYECYRCGNITPEYEGEYLMNRFYCGDCAYTVTQMTVGTQAPSYTTEETTTTMTQITPTIGTQAPSTPVTTTTTSVTTTTVGTSWTSEPVTTTDISDIPLVGDVVAPYGNGDANLDGVTDLTDLTELSLFLLGDKEFSEYELYAVDVNQDGKVDIADLPTLKMMITKGNGV